MARARLRQRIELTLSAGSGTRLRAASACALLLASLACAHLQSATPAAPLELGEELAAVRSQTILLARLRATPHNYFRIVNEAFTREVCRRFAGSKAEQVHVTLHGDCHVEQYAVTETGRGLTDFDDSASGPAYVDLVRFGVSLHLAARQRGWRADAERLFSAFYSGYRAALRDPELTAPEPRFVKRIKESFDYDRERALARAEALMDTLPEIEPELDSARRELSQHMLADNAGVPEWFFYVKKVGRLRIGIGSALSAKFLARVEGPTRADDDDIMLEAKELTDRQGFGCVRVDPGPSRIFTGDARLAYQPFRYPGVIHLGNRTLWVHAWPDNYVELAIQSVESVEELRQVVYDAGVQLGRGHPKTNRVQDATLLRAALLRELPEGRIRSTVVALTRDTIAAWRTFREQTREPGP